MKLLKSILKEFFILGVLFACSFALGKIAVILFFSGRSEIDIWIDGTREIFDLTRIALLLFVPLVCFIYGVRFLFFRPRNLHVGVIAFSYMIVMHVVIQVHFPLYLQYRLLTTDERPAEVEPEYNDQGYPIFDDNYMNQVIKAHHEYEAGLKNELLWFQLPLAAVTIFLLALVLFEFFRKKRIVQNP